MLSLVGVMEDASPGIYTASFEVSTGDGIRFFPVNRQFRCVGCVIQRFSISLAISPNNFVSIMWKQNKTNTCRRIGGRLILDGNPPPPPPSPFAMTVKWYGTNKVICSQYMSLHNVFNKRACNTYIYQAICNSRACGLLLTLHSFFYAFAGECIFCERTKLAIRASRWILSFWSLTRRKFSKRGFFSDSLMFLTLWPSAGRHFFNADRIWRENQCLWLTDHFVPSWSVTPVFVW